MAQLRDISAPAVQAAIREFDQLGRDAFLHKYGFGPARHYFLLHSDRVYDSKALIGAAHGHQFGEPLAAADFSGGLKTVVPALQALGFDVVADEHSRRPI